MPVLPRRASILSSIGFMLVTTAVLAALAGCSGSGGPGMSANEPLPPLDAETSLSVDEGRVAVTSPKGWVRAPRSKDYLVRYQRGAKKPYPAVTVTVSDPPDGVESVGKEGHAAFVETMAAKLAERFTKDGKSSLTRGPTPVVLGEHCSIAWAAPGRAKNGSVTDAIDRLSYAVVMNGRLYTVEARSLRGKLDAEGILAAKAVASALALPKPAAPAAETVEPPEAEEPEGPAAESKDGTETEPDADSPPADAKPAAGE